MTLLCPCKIWQGGKSSRGYGVTWRNGKAVSVHRQTYEDAHGPIPKGLVVRHKCDVRSCYELSHLELGTPKQNTRDMVDRGRARGGRPRTHSDETNLAILRAISEGQSHTKIAKELGVSTTHVHRIRRRSSSHG